MEHMTPQRQWATPTPVYIHPAPVVACRPAMPHEVPKGAATVARYAALHGWRVRVTYAKGWTLPDSHSPTKLVESVAVRLGKVGRRAYGIWIDGSFKNAGRMLGGVAYPIRGYASLREYIGAHNDDAAPEGSPERRQGIQQGTLFSVAGTDGAALRGDAS